MLLLIVNAINLILDFVFILGLGMTVSGVALLLNQAAKLIDLDLATCQLVLSIFGILAFALDAFAYAAEALVGEAIVKRNAMLFSAAGFGIALILLTPWSLQGLLAAFVGYLGLRGASLWWHIDRIYAKAGAPSKQ